MKTCKKEEEKVCPILSINLKIDPDGYKHFNFCIKEKCALFFEGKCGFGELNWLGTIARK